MKMFGARKVSGGFPYQLKSYSKSGKMGGEFSSRRLHARFNQCAD